MAGDRRPGDSAMPANIESFRKINLELRNDKTNPFQINE
jgi:hypothetical protein